MTKQQRRTVHGGAGVLACALALAAAGCGGGGGSDTQTVTQASTQNSVTLADHLTLSLSEDKANASVGDSVTYQITLTNATAAPITSTYAGYGPVGTTLDALVVNSGFLAVKDSHGNLIGNDGGFAVTGLPLRPPDTLTFTLQPGQSLPYTTIYRFQPGV